MNRHTGNSYQGIALKYAAVVDQKPWNAHYERPATLSLLPPLANKQVLDAGCGSGWYAEYLLSQGAQVSAFDLDPQFVMLTRERTQGRATVHQADLTQPLNFAQSASYDLVLCSLALHYIEDWLPVLQEFHRVLKPGGALVFSTHHPFMDWQNFKTEDYFATELLEDEWDIGKVWFYRRPLTAMSEAIEAAGLQIARLLEPKPTEAFRELHPEGYARLSRNPWFLVIRAVKPA